MLALIYGIAGIVLFFLVIFDIIKTTLSMEGGGVITSGVSRGIWNTAFYISGKNAKSPILKPVGYIILILIVVLWILLLWSSLFILLLAVEDSVINATTQISANNWEKFYYAGFIISTVGIGDFIANSNMWKIISDIYAFTGLVFITMSITYFIPVLSAVIKQKQLSLELNSLGSSPHKILENGWDGQNFDRLVKQSSALSQILFLHSQNHRAYPVIHYFHSSKKNTAITLQIAKLYEALILLQNFVKEEYIPHPQEFASINASIENYISVVMEVGKIKDTYNNPPPVYNISQETYISRHNTSNQLPAKLQENRSILEQIVANSGWSWKAVYNMDINT